MCSKGLKGVHEDLVAKMLTENKIEKRKKAILTLSNTKGVGYFSIRRLYSLYKNLEEIIHYNIDDLSVAFRKAGVKYADRLVKEYYFHKDEIIEKVERQYFDLISKRKVNFILEDETLFPESLKTIPDRPFWLFVEGNVDVLNFNKNAAVVGTRHPTQKGIKITEELTKYLVEKKFIIVSGLAQGIDETAHNVTNELGGKGIAILGCGINLAFPGKTYKVRKALLANGGAIISEFMLNDSYSKRSFYWRNRIQSGLSNVIFPIQGSLKSGTAHTVNFAIAQKKKIIGIYLNEIEPVPQNQLLSYLKSNKYPVINLSTDLEKVINLIFEDRIGTIESTQMELFKIEKAREEVPQETGIEKKKIKQIVEKIINFVKRLFQ